MIHLIKNKKSQYYVIRVNFKSNSINLAVLHRGKLSKHAHLPHMCCTYTHTVTTSVLYHYTPTTPMLYLYTPITPMQYFYTLTTPVMYL